MSEKEITSKHKSTKLSMSHVKTLSTINTRNPVTVLPTTQVHQILIISSKNIILFLWKYQVNPRGSPRDRVGDLPVFCARGVGHLRFIFAQGVKAFAIDINSRNFQMLTIFIFISSSTFYSKVLLFIELVFENRV